MLNRSFWKNRKVFVTGHTGFKGAWLSLWLEALGADVTGYALDPPTVPSLFEDAGVGGVITDRRGDVSDPRAVDEVVATFDPDRYAIRPFAPGNVPPPAWPAMPTTPPSATRQQATSRVLRRRIAAM